MPRQEKMNTIQSRNLAWSDDVSWVYGIDPRRYVAPSKYVSFVIVNRPHEDPYIFTPGLKRYDDLWPPSLRWRLKAPCDTNSTLWFLVTIVMLSGG